MDGVERTLEGLRVSRSFSFFLPLISPLFNLLQSTRLNANHCFQLYSTFTWKQTDSLVSSLSVYSSTLPRLRSIASSQPKMTRSVGVMSEKKHWKCFFFFGLINSNAAPDKYNPLLLEMKVDSERKGHICMAQHAINRFGKLSPPSETTTIADKLTRYLLEPNGSAMESHWKN